jgi:hypothetical protein
MRPAWQVLPIFLLALAACNKPDASPAAEGQKPTAEARPAPTATAAAAATTAAPAAAAPAPAALPARPGRSPMPTLAEWNAQQKEVTVKGSSALGCETKIVREYLRVSCRGKNDSGGTPTGVVIKKGGRGEAFAYVGAGVTSLVVPFVEGIDFEADFSWTDKSHPLVVKWAKGAPRPQIVGTFEGAKSPLDKASSDAALAERLCACHKKVTGEATCESMIGGANPDCDRTYGSNCEMLLACSRGEPGAMPRCQPGYINAGIGFCAKECGPGKGDCPAGSTCEESYGGRQACIEN